MLLTHHSCVPSSLKVARDAAGRARTDPTGTAPVIRSWDAELGRRFARVKRTVRAAVVTRDMLGIGDDPLKRVDSISSGGAARVIDLVRSALAREVLASADWRTSWMNAYAARAVAKGVTDAFRRMKQAGMDVTLQLTLDAPVGRAAQRRADFIAQQNYELLSGVDADTAEEMQKIISNGLLEGKGPQQIARELDEELDVGRTRARVIARTETIAAHADATLDAYEEAGLDAVTAEVEFATAGDNRVCPECEDLNGNTYTIAEARGMIPVHPNCRCAWLPVIASVTDAYDPSEPRVPAGQAGGGQWTGGGGAGFSVYKSMEGLGINEALREGKFSKLEPRLQKAVGELDREIAASPKLEDDLKVWRGLDEDFDAREWVSGTKVIDRGFVSTTTEREVAAMFSGSGSIMEIDLPKGMRVLMVSPEHAQPIGGYEDQKEVLLPRSLTYRVTDKKKLGPGRFHIKLAPVVTIKDYDPSEPRVPAGEPGGGQWRGENLTKEERTEVQHYTAEGYSTINERLRQGFSSIHAALIDSAIAKSVLTSDTVVYRGVNLTAFTNKLDTLQPGETITDKGFVSTSGSLATAATFSRGLVMEIRLPAGSRALYVEDFSASKGEEEDEYLLPRGSTFVYVTRRTTKTGRKIYTFDLAPRTTADWNPLQPRVPAGQAGGGEWIEGGSAGGGATITTRERAEVYHYTNQGYLDINEVLRAGEINQSKYLRDSVELIDSAIAKSETQKEFNVFRGINSAQFIKSLETLRPGETITDAGFVSTSQSYLAASQYAGKSQPVLDIRMPAGSRALYVEGISASKGEGEEEYILPRDSVLRYRGKVGEETGSTRYQFDLVQQSARDWNPFQPRLPKGSAGGGEWTEGGATGSGTLTGSQSVGLQPVHVDAIKQYTANIYVPLNQGLRKKETLRTAEEQVMRALDEAFERNQRTSEVMQLFRAAGEEFANVVDTLKVGDDVVDPGFVSTSFDERTARDFLSNNQGSNKVLVEIVLPKDSRAIQTEKYNPFKGENETLLPRDTKFRYLGKERDVYRFRANPRPAA